MPFREQERQRQRRLSDDLPRLPDDVQVLSFPDWCQLNAISVRTGRKIKASDKGPCCTDGVLSFLSKAREASGSEAARVAAASQPTPDLKPV